MKRLLYVGAASNMCILHRADGTLAMSRWGYDVVVVRDEVDAMFSAQVIPTPSHLSDRISPIFAPFFLVFSRFSPSRRQDSRNRHQDPDQRSETAAKRSRKGGPKPFNRKRTVGTAARPR